MVVPLAGVESEPLKLTCSGAAPAAVEEVITAVGGVTVSPPVDGSPGDVPDVVKVTGAECGLSEPSAKAAVRV
jgi:hypothetical protein